MLACSADAPPSPTVVGRRTKGIVSLLLVAQLGLMLAFSSLEYQRFALNRDFAIFNQAWWSIAHGHLDPFSTVLGTKFWHNDSDFIVWALSPLYWIDRSGVVLLWIQDLAVFATEIVTFRWVCATLEQRPMTPRLAQAIAAVAAGALLIDPWAWETIAFAFRTETLAALFVVLLARDLLAVRRRAWLWAAATMLCCAPAIPYVIGAGFAGLLTSSGRRGRILAATVAVVGLGWLTLVSRIGGAGLAGANVSHWYGYLVGGSKHTPGALAVALGVVRHPEAVLHLIGLRWETVFGFLVVVGLVGLATPWGFCITAVVIGPSLVNHDPGFLTFLSSFQTWPALPFVLVGSVTIIARLSQGSARRQRFAVATLGAWAVVAGIAAASVLPSVVPTWVNVSGRTARALEAVDTQVPPGSELITDSGIAGRFAQRSDIRAAGLGSTPIDQRRIVIVLLGGQGAGDPTPTDARLAAHRLTMSGARLRLARRSLYVLDWNPPSDLRSVQLP